MGMKENVLARLGKTVLDTTIQVRCNVAWVDELNVMAAHLGVDRSSLIRAVMETFMEEMQSELHSEV